MKAIVFVKAFMEKWNEQEHNLESGESTYGPNREKRGERAVFNVQSATCPGGRAGFKCPTIILL